MGKGAIIIALAALMATSAIYLTQDQSSASRIEEEVDYQEQVLAREAAQSAFNIVAAKVKRDFSSVSTHLWKKMCVPAGTCVEDIGASCRTVGASSCANAKWAIPRAAGS